MGRRCWCVVALANEQKMKGERKMNSAPATTRSRVIDDPSGRWSHGSKSDGSGRPIKRVQGVPIAHSDTEGMKGNVDFAKAAMPIDLGHFEGGRLLLLLMLATCAVRVH
uniref:Uncharacterized protein n=1 Tax=Trichuris muris TaxID=70415 RepID=A0A5S6R343_TRIMR